MASTSYSSAPLGSSQRSSDLLSAAKSMVSQTKAQGSTPYAGSSYAKEYVASSPTAQAPVIPVAETIQPVQPVPTIPKPQVNAPGTSMLDQQMRNLQLGLNADGTQTTPPTTQMGVTPAVAPVQTAYEKFAADYGIPKPEKTPSVTEAYYASDAYKNMVATQNRLTGLTGQLGAITAKATADQLSVTGQGRGIPEVIIGGQQAQIAKEAAIAALPLQAQIAAEQGNLELAKTHLDTWSRLMVADLEAERAYKKEVRDNIIQFATADQAAKIKAADRVADQKFEMDKMATQFKYEKELKNIGLDSGGNAPKIVSVNGVDSIWNGTQYVPITSTGISQKSQDALNALSIVDSLTSSGQLENVVGINRLNPFNYIPGAKVQYAKNQFNEIRNLLSLENRQKLKGQGAVSDFEGKMLAQASSALSTSLSNEDAKRELAKVRGAFANAAGLPSTVQITDPSTGKSVIVSATREIINQALIDGARVEYK